MLFGITGIGDESNNFSSRNINLNRMSLGENGTPVSGIYFGSFTMTPNNGAAISTFVEQTQTISGISVGDMISLDISGTPAAYVAFERAYISSANTLTIVWRNLHHSSSVTDGLSYTDTVAKTFRYLWFDLT